METGETVRPHDPDEPPIGQGALEEFQRLPGVAKAFFGLETRHFDARVLDHVSCGRNALGKRMEIESFRRIVLVVLGILAAMMIRRALG